MSIPELRKGIAVPLTDVKIKTAPIEDRDYKRSDEKGLYVLNPEVTRKKAQ